jgi:HAD superfamily hydrolase (TIGR01549 family)
MLMKKAVIFDIDGTLLDSVDLHAQAWQEALKHFGHDLPIENVRQQIGKGGDQLLSVFLSPEELKKSGEAIEKYRSELFKKKYLPEVRPFPKVRELFEHINGFGQIIALASSCKRDELKVYKKIANIEDLVGVEVTGDDVEKSKPHPDIFQTVLDRLAPITVHDAIAVGDSPYDAQAAGKIGLDTIGMLCGGFPEAELYEAGCIAIYNDPADLLEHYESSPAFVD